MKPCGQSIEKRTLLKPRLSAVSAIVRLESYGDVQWLRLEGRLTSCGESWLLTAERQEKAEGENCPSEETNEIGVKAMKIPL
jgi:hypothetical protein